MITRLLTCFLILTLASAARAQAPAAADATQLALIEAQFKAWRTAVTQLLGRDDVKAMRLKPVEVEAYAAALLDVRLKPDTTSPTGAPGARTDLADVARRMARLHRDQDASYDVVDTWMRNAAGA